MYRWEKESFINSLIQCTCIYTHTKVKITLETVSIFKTYEQRITLISLFVSLILFIYITHIDIARYLNQDVK